MGKADVAHLKPTNLPRQLEMAQDHPKLFTVGPDKEDKSKLPADVERLTNQVGGHMGDRKGKGMLKWNNMVLKPITKESTGQRELEFYEDLQEATEDCLVELKEFAPKFYGTKTFIVGEKEVKHIALEDLTKDFKEPCIMDIKIGRRTWDPLAHYQKIINEDNKYQGTKRDLGLSVPGFLVYRIANGRICRFDKDYGKLLTVETFKDSLRTFFNGDVGLNRDLLLQILVDLWRIQRWARKQRRIRLYASSLLLIYDARRLKQLIANKAVNCTLPKSISTPCTATARAHLYKPLSLMKLNDDCPCTGFSGQFTKEGPILKPTPSIKLGRFPEANGNVDAHHPWRQRLSKLRRVHSFQNNYDKDLQKLRKDYTNMLDDLVNEHGCETWATVKMIDFAHVFRTDHNEVDKNYLEGVENLIKIVEGFLCETVDT